MAVREIMTEGAECLRTDATAREAATAMARQGVGAVAICGADDRIKGMLTDRDIVADVVAHGRSVDGVRTGELVGDRQPVLARAEESADAAMRAMASHQVRRLPVIDGDQLVGVVSMGDVARAMPRAEVGELASALSAD